MLISFNFNFHNFHYFQLLSLFFCFQFYSAIFHPCSVFLFWDATNAGTQLWQLWISSRFCLKYSKSAAVSTYCKAVVICRVMVSVIFCSHSGYPPIMWTSSVTFFLGAGLSVQNFAILRPQVQWAVFPVLAETENYLHFQKEWSM